MLQFHHGKNNEEGMMMMNISIKKNENENEITETFEKLECALKEREDFMMDNIAEFALSRDLEKLQIESKKVEKTKEFLNKVIELKYQWQNTSSEDRVNRVVDENSEKDAVCERTDWKISNEHIKIETKRQDGPPYSNVFPISLFKEIIKVALDFIDRNKYVKTADVLKVLENRIISESDYKKTPRLPVYASFKVLVKENLFKVDENNSHKYLLNTDKNHVISWMNKK
jgi:hypothetical protein